MSLSAAKRDQLQSDYSNLEYLVIDEISMVSDNMFHFVHQRLEEIKKPQSCTPNQIFGNCSVIAFGDFYQLQPVAAHYIFDQVTYTGEMNLWLTHFKPIFLLSNIRQNDDSEYANLLNRVRIGKQTSNDIQILVQRTNVNVDEAPFKNALRLFPTRKQCLEYNNFKLKELSEQHNSEVFQICAIDINSNTNQPAPPKLIPADDSECGGLPSRLFILPGARVMLLRNIMTTDELVNGSQGTVESIVFSDNQTMPHGVKVLFDDPRIGKLFKDSTTQAILIKPVTVDFFGKEGIQIERTQIPLMPSWAITIHKSQGMTMSNVVINLGPKCNKPGQAYVALSRVKCLHGLALTEFTEKSIKVARKVTQEMQRLLDL